MQISIIVVKTKTYLGLAVRCDYGRSSPLRSCLLNILSNYTVNNFFNDCVVINTRQ